MRRKNIYEMMSMLLNDNIPERKLIYLMSDESEIDNTIKEIEENYKGTSLFSFLDESANNDWRIGLQTKSSDDGSQLLGKAYLYDATNNTIKSMVFDLATGEEIK